MSNTIPTWTFDLSSAAYPARLHPIMARPQTTTMAQIHFIPPRLYIEAGIAGFVEVRARIRRRSEADLQWHGGLHNLVVRRKDRHSLHRILKLARVPRPGIVLQDTEDLIRDGLAPEIVSCAELGEEILGQV